MVKNSVKKVLFGENIELLKFFFNYKKFSVWEIGYFVGLLLRVVIRNIVIIEDDWFFFDVTDEFGCCR